MLSQKGLSNILPSQPFSRHGDKHNSDYFEQVLLKIYKQRDKMGLTDNVRKIVALVIQVEMDMAAPYIAELSLMTLYTYQYSWVADGYRWHLLRISNQQPDVLVREQIQQLPGQNFVAAQSYLTPGSRQKLHTRYIGEIFSVRDLALLQSQLQHLAVALVSPVGQKGMSSHIVWTEPSVYSWNSVGYRQEQVNGYEYWQEQSFTFTDQELQSFIRMKLLQKELEIDEYILPYDHLATRVFSHDREHAILEFLTMTSYYFWGAFDITEQNSSTNVLRSVHQFPEEMSPAKVFTANNTPYYVQHITGLPSPTEDFVRNNGRRMHHLAVGVKDGFVGPESDDFKNVDFVVQQLKKAEKQFLAHVVGSCDEGLKQIFSQASPYSGLITEYIQRCYDYEGFFTKQNVAALTMAAGKDVH